ncbi:hypothetical protein Tco_1522556 [Tanacetum coccineum]
MITTVQSAVKIAIQQHEQAVQKKQEEQATFTPYWKFPIFDDDDDEYNFSYKGEYLEKLRLMQITSDLSTKEPDNSLNNSLPEYDSFLFEFEPDQGELTGVVMEDILGEHRVHNVLPNHPNLMLDSDFAPFDDSLGSDLVVSFPFGTRNKIFNPGIFIEVQSKIFLSPNEFSIIRDPLSPVFDTLLPF